MDLQLFEFRPGPDRWALWEAVEPTLTGRGFNDLRAALMSGEVENGWKDEVLGALVRLGRGDEEARVAVVLCLMPGLRAAARRYGVRVPPLTGHLE